MLGHLSQGHPHIGQQGVRKNEDEYSHFELQPTLLSKLDVFQHQVQPTSRFSERMEGLFIRSVMDSACLRFQVVSAEVGGRPGSKLIKGTAQMRFMADRRRRWEHNMGSVPSPKTPPIGKSDTGKKNSIPLEDILEVYRYKPSVTQFCKTMMRHVHSSSLSLHPFAMLTAACAAKHARKQGFKPKVGKIASKQNFKGPSTNN
ncbi:uncharacterized protein LOC121284813 isoform X3 [Carcharodon carcharias]|uniref:uncharacterized protein LOC121284813 isoform X3 n=1 Tax=Carcharodon carcharias TaxID=13397 RepID=UPI001B7EB70E|nr:uncharacterized protein LOC121284813 isoform X3 [Carcharodon carcharias]XP_041056471.1 uncharacterized protein LOC121284813 isoform X3 [Carcharodon carcharias]